MQLVNESPKPDKMKSLFPAGHLFKLTYILVLIAFLVSCQSEKSKPKEIVQNYGTGEVSRRYTEINNKKEGLMTDYYTDGSVKIERMFENDIQVGKSTIYYPSGKIKEVQYYSEGKLTGGDTTFYESGNLQFLRNFKNGVKDGYIRKWAEDGSIIYEAKFSMDTLIEVKGEPILSADTLHVEGYTSPKGFK